MADEVKNNKPGRRLLLWSGPVIILVVGVALYLHGGRFATTDNAYLKSNKVSVSAEVSGRVTEIAVTDNDHVEAGASLFHIDRAPYEIAVSQAEAQLADTRSAIESMRADYMQKKADANKDQADVDYHTKLLERDRQLLKTGVIAKDTFDQEQRDYNNAIGELASAQQELASAQAKLVDPSLPTEEHPRFKEAMAQLDKAKLDLSRVDVAAPFGGIVANVTMRPGEYVVAGLPLFSLVDDKHIWVEANFKETDLTNVRPGQTATLTVDTYPGKTWTATVDSITPATGSEFSILPAENSSGNWVKVVQRIMVRLEFTDYNGTPPLAAGMSAYAKIDTGTTRLGRWLGHDTK